MYKKILKIWWKSNEYNTKTCASGIYMLQPATLRMNIEFQSGDSEYNIIIWFILNCWLLTGTKWPMVQNKTQSVRALQIDSGWVEILLPPIFRQTLASHTALWTEETTQSFPLAPEIQIEIPKSHLTKKTHSFKDCPNWKGGIPLSYRVSLRIKGTLTQICQINAAIHPPPMSDIIKKIRIYQEERDFSSLFLDIKCILPLVVI